MSDDSSTTTKPYVCSVCGRKFGRGEHLRRHASAHANVKPFQCKFCQKRFARKYESLSLKAVSLLVCGSVCMAERAKE
jgi:uncharacterized Zn-finger protein